MLREAESNSLIVSKDKAFPHATLRAVSARQGHVIQGLMPMRNLDPEPFKSLIEQVSTVLLDVRMPEELEIASLPGAVNIPLPELGSRIAELNPNASIAVLCHHGVRSEMAGRFLERNGFTDVAHLTGGIDAWSQIIDSQVPRY